MGAWLGVAEAPCGWLGVAEAPCGWLGVAEYCICIFAYLLGNPSFEIGRNQ